MSARLLGLLVLAMVIVACSSGGAAPTVGAPTAAPGGPTAAPGGPTTAPAGGSMESIARALVPPGSNEVSGVQSGGSYTLIVTTTMSIEELKTFYAQAVPASGATSSGQFEVGGTLTISLTNPDGGIVATPGGAEGNLVTISVGTT